MNKKPDKALLNLGEFCDYLGIGKTKGRQVLLNPGCDFCVRIGNRLYAHKGRLDKYLESSGRLI